MTEANPPAKHEDFRRRILFYLEEELSRGVDHPHWHAIADALNETEELTTGQSEILQYQGLVALRRYHLGALVKLTPNGLLEIEKLTQTAPQPDSPPSAEPSPEPQEFKHSPDYASVIWRGQEYQFNENQATCVRLLHEACLERHAYLSGHHLLSEIQGAVKMSGLYRRHPAWKRLILIGERKATYRLNLSALNPPVKRR